jgi:hypothetical protein
LIASVEIVKTPEYRQATRIWRDAVGAWKHRERARGGRQIVGAQFTFRGDDLYAPWGPKPRLFPNALRADGWGWFGDFRRVMILSRWDSREALDAYEEGLRLPDGSERWMARLRPVKVRGRIEGEQILGDFLDAAGTGHKPGLSMTWNKHGLWHEPAFHSWVRRIADDSQRSPGVIASMSTGWALGLPYFRAFTLTFWNRLDDSLRFAYRREDHKGVIDWYGNPERFTEPWWGRFVVEESRGTLAGRDPFAGLELDPAPPERAAPEPAAATG